MKPTLVARSLLALAAAACLAAAPVHAQAPVAFVVESIDAIDTARGGPVRAAPVSAPAAAGLRRGDVLAGDVAVEHLPDGQRRLTIRWTSVVGPGSAVRRLAPPAETMLRTPNARIPEKTRMRVAWTAVGAGAATSRIPDVPPGPNAAQDALNRRAREAGRLGASGSGDVITLDMLMGNVRNPLDPPRPPR